MQTITGNTYPLRDRIKSLGGKWNAQAKGWDVPDVNVAEIKKLMEAQAKQPQQPMTTTQRIAAAARKRGETPGICSSCGDKCKFPYTECWDCKQEREMGY